METVFLVHMCFFYMVLLLLQLILYEKEKKKQLNFWLHVTRSLEEGGNRIDNFRCLFQYYLYVLPLEPARGSELCLLAAGRDIDIVMVKARLWDV